MLRINTKFLASRSRRQFAVVPLLIGLAFGVTSCDRGASEQEQAALKFADAVARNEQPRRDSMIATGKFLEYFHNPYVASDMLSWFRVFYDYQTHHFHKRAKVDVDRDLTKELAGALLDTNSIKETGVVLVPSPIEGDQPAVFWMVRQAGEHWKVAIVTRGEATVNFN